MSPDLTIGIMLGVFSVVAVGVAVLSDFFFHG